MTQTHQEAQAQRSDPSWSFYSRLYGRLYRFGYHRKKDYSHAKGLIEKVTATLAFDSVLDIGCSHGWSVEHFREMGKRAIGVDVAPKAIAHAARLGRAVCAASATGLPFPDATFDLVMSTDCFEHLRPEDVDAAVGEAVRVSRRYLAMKINPRRDHNGTWKLIGGTDLHLTLMPVETWIERFCAKGCRLLEHDEANEEFVLEKA
ncbi:MAG: class I SAM-dependent methyltransferase [Phycisphaeraceae bacterium]|nr:class I SAM-dependent methyltransferase [Phycisphaeraceae bacterium]